MHSDHYTRGGKIQPCVVCGDPTIHVVEGEDHAYTPAVKFQVSLCARCGPGWFAYGIGAEQIIAEATRQVNARLSSR